MDSVRHSRGGEAEGMRGGGDKETQTRKGDKAERSQKEQIKR